MPLTIAAELSILNVYEGPSYACRQLRIKENK